MINIYSLDGQKIINLVNSQLNAGIYNAIWDGKNTDGLPVPSGVYIYKLDTESFSSIKKMILLK